MVTYSYSVSLQYSATRPFSASLQGKPVRPAILWYDARATDQLGELQRALSPTDYRRDTGKQEDHDQA